MKTALKSSALGLVLSLASASAIADSSHNDYISDAKGLLKRSYDNSELTNASQNFWQLLNPVAECIKAANRIVYYDNSLKSLNSQLNFVRTQNDPQWVADVQKDISESRS